ncbi:hypothetical protein F5Y14DRAFT_406146 [Nemania sp. NC0429]|nr:hypothetical protein F5Y14DRAFT_406146 [Nemania sp. NC0429]
MNRPRKYADILPSPTGLGESSSASGSQPPSEDLPRRRPGPSVACEECRTRKTRCDGARPACSNCVKRGKPTCVYLDKQKAGPTAMQWLDRLKTWPKHRALILLNSLRARDNLNTVLSEFPQPEQAIEALGTPSSLLEAELMATNPNAYPVLKPIDISVFTQSRLLHPTTNAFGPGKSSGGTFIDQDSSVRHFPDLKDPTEAIQYCDERLAYLQADFWADVAVSNDFTARAISLYMHTDHPLLGLFDTELFITDLVERQTRFCSRFLFHALMYLACQMYSAFDKNAMQYAEPFGQRAEELWEDEEDSCLAMAGAVLLSVSNMGRGKDHDAVLIFSRHALEMGQRLGLFSAHPARSPRPIFETEEDGRANSYGAWGTFNWNVLISQFYRQPILQNSVVVPTVPIPGEADVLEPEGNLFDETESVDRGLLGDTFPVLCRFRLITHGARWVQLPVPHAPDTNLRLSLFEHKYRQLLAWLEILPSYMLRAETSPHHTIVFHIWLHTAILDALRPFIRAQPEQRLQLTTFSASDRSPDAAYAASVNQLKRLVLDHRIHHSASAYSILWHSGLIYLANAMIKQPRDPEWRQYLYLCVYGYERLNRPYRISEVILQGLLAMALRHTDISAEEAQRLMMELKKRGLDQSNKIVEDRVHATFMVDLDLALTDPANASVETVAADFNYFALFQDLVEADQMAK